MLVRLFSYFVPGLISAESNTISDDSQGLGMSACVVVLNLMRFFLYAEAP